MATTSVSKLRPVDKAALDQLPEKQRELLITLIELGGSVIEVKSVLDDLGRGRSLDEIAPDLLVRELTFRASAASFDTSLKRYCGDLPDAAV